MPTFPKSIAHILAVDDIYDNLLLIETILDDEGYEIELATDGLTALTTVEQCPPDLILLDVMMPEIHGYEVTRRIRDNPNLPYIPILLITANEQSSVVEGLDAGADDFIRKPFDTDELLARVRSLIRLKRSIDEREEMLRQREDFVSRLTHDLRIPLVAANRMLNLFLQEAYCPLSGDMKEAIQIVIRSNQNLLQMVNTLLEVSRHDAGQKKLSLIGCDMHTVCEEVVQELMPLAQEKGLSLTLEPSVNDANDATTLGDRLELHRVFANLIGNAIKFTDTGSIVISLSKQPVSATEPQRFTDWITIAIRDTGSGISAEDQAVIFERFRQGNNRRADSGLGLYLSRRIIEAHEGLLRVESKLGQGSTFTVYLPARS